ncbi:MAG: amino acid permease [Myxococcota bacterium]
MDHDDTPQPARFGSFAGVYRPVVLTVLGAMLYLREGWLVGTAGLGGALLVIGAAYLVTGTTALSVSSIATNLRLKAGGAFAVIAAALGLEAGGAIGVPLYFAQTISSVMYLYAFSEGWGYLFPEHSPVIVVLIAFAGVGLTALVSARLASQAQAFMLFVVIGAIASAFSGAFGAPVQPVQALGAFEEASLVECFALFFPAATGIMVGAGMSGDLADPSRSVPRGTMYAWATTLVVYVFGAFWYALVVPQPELLGNKLAMVEHALIGEFVLFGLLASTLMAALSSLVAAPRLLQAMAEHHVVPFSSWVAQQNGSAEPRNATLVTLTLSGLALFAGSLDAIAPIITSFFVMTYFAINVVVLLEQTLGLVSWRPMFRIPTVIPALGAGVCGLALTLSSPAGGLPEVAFVVGLYVWLVRRTQVDTPWETVQSGIAQALATWAATTAQAMGRTERTWKPDLLLPVASVAEARAMGPVAEAIVTFQGSVRLVGLVDDPDLAVELEDLAMRLRMRGLYATWHLMPEARLAQGAQLAINAMHGTVFAPNLLLLSARFQAPAVVHALVDHARHHQMGVILAYDEPERPMRPSRQATVWLSDRSPDFRLTLHVANLDLPVLLAYVLTRPVGGRVRLTTVIRQHRFLGAAQTFLEDLIQLGRLPDTTPHVLGGTLLERLADAPPTDVHLFGLSDSVDLDWVKKVQATTGGACLFVMDSGQESALA